ncbi:hypothetical protein JRO89_XS10G0103300 [Xanthoceras sorbifolium]|uniref:Uncharacterized protein n=1 Tax=Xanthoceras sorbifolium TaxID=99658 RepID=A0ABQ8HIB0_9ROSI|nr:hypothetical protein JRO89_XS10G0103300 [Xanthoceras sorbifolium]
MPKGSIGFSLTKNRESTFCFNCNARHRCKTPQLLLLEANATEEAELANEIEVTSPIVEISLKSLTLSPQNIRRLKGFIKKHCVTILVDLESTHKFLNPSLAKQCGHKVNFELQFSYGKRYNVPMNIQWFQFQLDFYLLPVSGYDIVLGADWSRSLGEFHRLLLQEKQGIFIQLIALTRVDSKISLPPNGDKGFRNLF